MKTVAIPVAMNVAVATLERTTVGRCHTRRDPTCNRCPIRNQSQPGAPRPPVYPYRPQSSGSADFRSRAAPRRARRRDPRQRRACRRTRDPHKAEQSRRDAADTGDTSLYLPTSTSPPKVHQGTAQERSQWCEWCRHDLPPVPRVSNEREHRPSIVRSQLPVRRNARSQPIPRRCQRTVFRSSPAPGAACQFGRPTGLREINASSRDVNFCNSRASVPCWRPLPRAIWCVTRNSARSADLIDIKTCRSGCAMIR